MRRFPAVPKRGGGKEIGLGRVFLHIKEDLGLALKVRATTLHSTASTRADAGAQAISASCTHHLAPTNANYQQKFRNLDGTSGLTVWREERGFAEVSEKNFSGTKKRP